MSRVLLFLVALALLRSEVASATPGPPPAGYTFVRVSDAIASADRDGISQLAFLPGDSSHLYAVLSASGRIVRYQYASDGTLSNALTVASGLTIPIGIAFRGDELYVSTNADADGRISRLRDLNHDGVYEERVDFVRGVPVREHYVDQLQIVGNTLYAGIGTRTNGGVPSCERIYCGVLARIADLTQVVYTGGANALPDSATFLNPAPQDGLLRRYASGFRNPFGLRVDATHGVWISDNGASQCTTCSTCNRFAIDTPDFLYGAIPVGARGQFPPAGFPGGGGATMAPLTNLGFHPAATGFAFIPQGPDAGQILLAEFGPTDPLPIGRDLLKIDPVSGAASSFLTGLDGPTDVVGDGAGRLLVSDYLTPAIYLLTPPAIVGVAGPGAATAGPLPRIDRITPNPTARGTAIEFSLARESFVTIVVHDLAGREVARLSSGTLGAGAHAVSWDGRDGAGRAVAPGVYLCRVETPAGTATARLVTIR